MAIFPMDALRKHNFSNNRESGTLKSQRTFTGLTTLRFELGQMILQKRSEKFFGYAGGHQSRWEAEERKF